MAFAKISRSSRSRRISRRRRRISSRSAVLGPSPRRPSSRSPCTTQLRIACAVGSNSRDNSSGLRPARTNSTIWRRNSGAYGGLDLGMVDTSSPKGQVSTNSGQLHSTLNRKIDSARVDETEVVTIELEADQVSLHDIGIIHGSSANSSSRRRAGLALRYMPSTSCMYREMPNAAADWTSMPMEVVRGVNRNDRNDFAPGDLGRLWPSA